MTEEEFLRLPDDGRKWELVDGEAREVLADGSLWQIEQRAYLRYRRGTPCIAVG